MSDIPKALLYTEDHEWVSVEDGVATVGITDHAQDQLGEIVYLGDFLDPEDEVEQGDTVAVVESSKASSDIYSPVSGTVVESNEELADSPELINSAPYSSWMIRVSLSDESELEKLMNAEAYAAFIEG
jgi:glycine cleavage system H protein